MRLAFRTGWLVDFVARNLRDLRPSGHHLSNVTPPVFSSTAAAGDSMSRQHWASDQLVPEPTRIPMSQASLIVRLLSQRRGGAWYWSPAEDGGVYLYRYDQDQPYTHIASCEIQARQASWARDGLGF